MSGTRLAALRDEFNVTRSAIEAIEELAVSEARDLNDDETAKVDELYARAEDVKGRIEPLAERERMLASTAETISRIQSARPNPAYDRKPAPEVKLPTAEEYIIGYLRSCRDPGSQDAIDFQRSVAQVVLADTPGIVPVPIVGPMINLLADDRRPVFDSFTSRPMPAAGKSFLRPRLTQRTLVGEQTAEFQQLASRKFTVTSDEVSKTTWGGVLELSQQDIDWTDPAVLSLVLADFVGEYAAVTEAAACDAFVAALDSDSPLDVTSTADTLTSFTTAAVQVYGTSKKIPNHLWLSLDQWAAFASLVNDVGDPLFPALGAGRIDIASGEFQGTPLGLGITVGPEFAAGTVILGNANYAESYEQKKGFLRVTQPSVLGEQIAIYGYVAFNFYPDAFTFLGTLPT